MSDNTRTLLSHSPRSCMTSLAASRCISCLNQARQSTATSSARQTSAMRTSASRPRRPTRTAIETLSTESRFTAERFGTGSSAGSSTTSLGNPRMVVVHGATMARRSRGIAASLDRTTTGRRPTSVSSHHHTSPRAGISFTTQQLPHGTMRGLPSRRPREAGARHRPHS